VTSCALLATVPVRCQRSFIRSCEALNSERSYRQRALALLVISYHQLAAIRQLLRFARTRDAASNRFHPRDTLNP